VTILDLAHMLAAFADAAFPAALLAIIVLT
jgi:hypothetical protein